MHTECFQIIPISARKFLRQNKFINEFGYSENKRVFLYYFNCDMWGGKNVEKNMKQTYK